ncbi:family 43 glycosylhydrolase [Brevundimonas sp.]|uniref:family 43 glycosylhydrolase n=1 Tax=Brevundimonas sp. TaxID=1871086 RepID=UPI0035AF4BAB
MRASLVLAVLALTSPAMAQEIRPRTWANQVDVDYKYNFEQTHRGISYRTGADPVIVLHRDRYFLFQTLADGYWTSADLLDWSYVSPNKWPFESNVAPAARSDGERLYLMQSAFEPRPVLVSEHPETGHWDWHTRILPPVPGAVSRNEEGSYGEGGLPEGKLPPGPWDPDLFIDDDGRWYLYWGSSNHYPLYAAEVDPDPPMRFLSEPIALHVLHPDRHGWERFGEDHSGGLPDGTPIRPYMEGAWMTKHGGRYYLQYGAPGTEYNAYANGAYVGDGPLGPFEYAPWNPISYKPGGFVEGAGHGSTFQDKHGNWWNTGTPWLGHNWTFERRIAMFPGRFEADGQMWFTSRFGDYPQVMPDGPVEDPERLFTGWFPLSYRAPAEASSAQPEHGPEHAVDENTRTYWLAAENAEGQTLTIELGSAKTVHAVQVNYADHESGVYRESPDIRTRFRLSWSEDGESWTAFADLSDSDRDRPNAYVEGATPVPARFLRYEHIESPGANLAIADLRVFGTAEGPAPAAPALLGVERSADQLNATVRFRPVGGALGYNVRWGLTPDRLTHTYQLYADEPRAQAGELEIRALNAGVDYVFAVEAFSPSGVSELSETRAAPAT